MSHQEALILAALAVLQLKHFVFDFALQRPYEFFRNKGTYGHPSGIIHAGMHAVASVPALLILGPSLAVLAAIMAGEFIVHYHIDWTKEQVMRRRQLSPATHYLVLGTDQLAHQLTYTAMLAFALA